MSVFVFNVPQQLRSYRKGAVTLNFIQETGGTGDQTEDLWVHGE